MEPGETFPPPFMGRVELRLHPDDAGFATGAPSGEPRVRGRFRLRDGEPIDTIGLVLAVDAFPPTAFNAQLPVAWTPTVELTAHVRARPAPGWLRCVFTTRFVTGGFLEEDGEIWDDTGRLVAQSRQLALIPRRLSRRDAGVHPSDCAASSRAGASSAIVATSSSSAAARSSASRLSISPAGRAVDGVGEALPDPFERRDVAGHEARHRFDPFGVGDELAGPDLEPAAVGLLLRPVGKLQVDARHRHVEGRVAGALGVAVVHRRDHRVAGEVAEGTVHLDAEHPGDLGVVDVRRPGGLRPIERPAGGLPVTVGGGVEDGDRLVVDGR